MTFYLMIKRSGRDYPLRLSIKENMRKFLFLLLYGCSYSLTIQIVYNYEYPIPKQYTPKPKPEYNFEEKIEIKDNQIRGLIMKPPQIVIFIQQGNNLLNTEIYNQITLSFRDVP